MNDGRSDCRPSAEAEALARVLAVSDLLDMVLWRETNPLTGVDRAITGLQVARGLLTATDTRRQLDRRPNGRGFSRPAPPRPAPPAPTSPRTPLHDENRGGAARCPRPMFAGSWRP